MFSQPLTVGPAPLAGAMNVEMGNVAILMKRNEILDILGPGRYSRSRLALMGIFPTAISMLTVRTAVSRFTADCVNVQMGEARVDLRAVVQVRLKLQGDLKLFFNQVMSAYGTDFGSSAPIIVQQLIEESLRGVGATRTSALASERKLRSSVADAMEPADIFEIVDVISLTVTRDDPISLQAEVDERLRPLERARRLAEVELAAAEGQLRAEGCLQLGARLGVDPLFLWDPEGFRADAAAQRQATVQLIGQYGDNLAVLAEATNMSAETLRNVLSPVLSDRHSPQGVEGGGRAQIEAGRVVPTLSSDEILDQVAMQRGIPFYGGVNRTTTLEGKDIRIAIAVTSRASIPSLNDAISASLPPGTLVGVFDGDVSAIELAGHVACWITGAAPGTLQISSEAGKLIWSLSDSLSSAGDVAEFAVESVCDLFVAPPLIPLAL